MHFHSRNCKRHITDMFEHPYNGPYHSLTTDASFQQASLVHKKQEFDIYIPNISFSMELLARKLPYNPPDSTIRHCQLKIKWK